MTQENMEFSKNKQLTFMDFCAGIGAGRLGLEQNGLKCVAYSEVNKHSINTYNVLHNAKNEKNYGDLTKIDCNTLPNFDVMIAGFPCQTFSIVGQRKGFEDDRGQIIYSLIKILNAKNVPYFILENVKGLVNHDKGRTLETILKLLDNAGYYVEHRVLNSLDYGVAQMRERIYFIGIKKNFYRKDKKIKWLNTVDVPPIKKYLIDNDNEISTTALTTFKKYINNKYNKNKYKLEELLQNEYIVLDTRQSDLRIYRDKIPTLRTGRQGILYVRDGKLRSLTGYEAILLQGFNNIYAQKVKDKELTNTNLLAQAGNAMTVTTISAICKSLIKYITEE